MLLYRRSAAVAILLMCLSLTVPAGAQDSAHWSAPTLSASASSGLSPEACNGSAVSNVTVCGPVVYSAGISAQSHAQFVTVAATTGMTSTGSSAGNLCSPWGGTVTAITLEAVSSSGAVLSNQAGASEPPSYRTYVLWPMSLTFVVPAGQGATIYLFGGPNGTGCGMFTYSLFAA
jgi:hypothetical protein